MKYSAKFTEENNFGLDSATSHIRDYAVAGEASGFYARFGKRALDLLVILLALPAILPLLMVIGLLVRSDGHPAFFMQERVGRRGKLFRVVKFRTMVPDAEAALQDHLAQDADAAREWHTYQKLRHDPRITPIGRVLRATSLDELPQLWNVAVGEMSLVGPRPMMPSQVSLYPGRHYTLMRPGITGPWQVSDRNASSFAVRGRFDTEYWADLSFKTDMILLWKTIFAVFSCTGR